MRETKTRIIGCRLTDEEYRIIKKRFGTVSLFVRDALNKIPEIKKLSNRSAKKNLKNLC